MPLCALSTLDLQTQLEPVLPLCLQAFTRFQKSQGRQYVFGLYKSEAFIGL